MTAIYRPSLTAVPTQTPDSRWRAAALLATAVAATGAFALLTAAVSRRQTEEADATLHEAVPTQVEEVREAAEAVSQAGKWYAYVPVAALVGAVVLGRGSSGRARRAAGAGAVLLSSITSALINPAFDRWLPQPPELPPGRAENRKPTFPSGHTFGLGSLTAAGTYVLLREDLAAASLVIPLAVAIPAASGFARMIEEKHWLSDVAGGALVAIAIAGTWTAMYELTSS